MTWRLHGLKVENDPNFFYLLEALKVEGYWSVKHGEASIDNKNVPLLKRIEKILLKYNIPVKKRLLIKFRPSDQEFSKQDIKIESNGKELAFHIERSPFDKKKKAVFFLSFKNKQSVLFTLKNKTNKIDISVNTEQISFNSPFDAFGYLELRFHAIEFIRFLNQFAKNKNSRNIRALNYFDLPVDCVLAALSALIDCEGTLDFYNLTRRIRIRMFNEIYLNDWKTILSKFDIRTRVKDGLWIEGFQDFKKLEQMGLNLSHSKKYEKWVSILNSYKKIQVSRNTAIDFYFNKMKELNKPLTATELAQITNKSKRVINHHLKRLSDKNLINIDKSAMVWKYFV